ncbi:MAG: hypothetical protein ACRD27_04165, partial [Terracidiphilus sp.]
MGAWSPPSLSALCAQVLPPAVDSSPMRYPVEETGESREDSMATNTIDRKAKQIVLTVQEYSLFSWRSFLNLFSKPIYWTDFLI